MKGTPLTFNQYRAWQPVRSDTPDGACTIETPDDGHCDVRNMLRWWCNYLNYEIKHICMKLVITNWMYTGVHVKYPLYLSRFKETLIFWANFRKPPISNFMKIRPVGAKLSHADRRTDIERHDEGKSRFSNLTKAPKKTKNNLQIKFLFADAEKPLNELSEIKFRKEYMNVNILNILLTTSELFIMEPRLYFTCKIYLIHVWTLPTKHGENKQINQYVLYSQAVCLLPSTWCKFECKLRKWTRKKSPRITSNL
jgi:hypothetical protein